MARSSTPKKKKNQAQENQAASSTAIELPKCPECGGYMEPFDTRRWKCKTCKTVVMLPDDIERQYSSLRS